MKSEGAARPGAALITPLAETKYRSEVEGSESLEARADA